MSNPSLPSRATGPASGSSSSGSSEPSADPRKLGQLTFPQGPGSATGEALPRPAALLPSVSLPKGGGAVAALGDSLTVQSATGAAGYSVPFALPSARGMAPGLGLSYGTTAGQGPFGLGWTLGGVSSIQRKTDRGVPTYGAKDVFIHGGLGELTAYDPGLVPSAAIPLPEFPEVDADGEVAAPVENYSVRLYRPQKEGPFVQVERWRHTATGDVHWQTLDGQNVRTVYGLTPQARIAHPTKIELVYEWLIERVIDDRGNVMQFDYREEDAQGGTPLQKFEENQHASISQRYLQRVWWGNQTMYAGHASGDGTLTHPDADFLFECTLDYGDHEVAEWPDVTEGETTRPSTVVERVASHHNMVQAPSLRPAPGSVWPVRPDAISAYRSGFEIRTRRLCQQVLVIHRFSELVPDGTSETDAEGLTTGTLVRSYSFVYSTTERSALTQLTAVHMLGWKRSDAPSGYDAQMLPPVSFSYQDLQIGHKVEAVDGRGLDGIAANDTLQWTDLDHRGLPGLLVQRGAEWYYKPNQGGGKLGAMTRLPEPPSWPTGSGRGDGTLALMDIASDGQTYAVTLGGGLAGSMPLQRDKTGSFRPFKNVPSIPWSAGDIRMMDVDGDGRADLVVLVGDRYHWFRSEGRDGFQESRASFIVDDTTREPLPLWSDPEQSVFLADMSGDGLQDLVRLRDGEVSYWPNLGHGRFGARIRMASPPRFSDRLNFDPARV
ncbi:MAG: VCBS repeat-containing protein, partial [Chloroflexi bacterium]|nr:VCBS repeat-containing protein [Chloroflexota bacterium]